MNNIHRVLIKHRKKTRAAKSVAKSAHNSAVERFPKSGVGEQYVIVSAIVIRSSHFPNLIKFKFDPCYKIAIQTIRT